jgi:hypothetical protein
MRASANNKPMNYPIKNFMLVEWCTKKKSLPVCYEGGGCLPAVMSLAILYSTPQISAPSPNHTTAEIILSAHPSTNISASKAAKVPIPNAIQDNPRMKSTAKPVPSDTEVLPLYHSAWGGLNGC